jgi:uncharacterized membrane protein YbhN (UPF0104 family)
VTLSLAILAWFALRVDYHALASLVRDVRLPLLGALAVLSLFRIWISAMRFRVLSALVVRIPFWTLVRQYFVAACFNNILPTTLGGDAVRLFMLVDCGLQKQEGLVLILAERMMGVAALAFLALIGISLYPMPPEVNTVVIAMALAIVVGMALVPASGPLARALASRFPWTTRAVDVFALLSRRPAVLARVLAASLVFQTASIALSWLVALGFDIEMSFPACLALVPLVWILTMLPISLGGIGLREASFAYLFGLIGFSMEESIAISLGTWAALVFTGLIGAGLLVAAPRKARQAAERLANGGS